MIDGRRRRGCASRVRGSRATAARRIMRIVPALSAALVLLAGAGPASAASGLDALSRDAETGPVELSDGHVDVGPALVDGSWRVQVKDDSGEGTVWRDAEDVVFRVGDAAEHALPDDAEYAFLGNPGDDLFLVPQTQVDGVVWLGWNTQHESVLEESPTDIAFVLDDIEGPGDVHVYLDYGGFREPEVLWASGTEPEPLEVEVNAHAHANWAFSAPGEYRVTFGATLTDAEGTAQEASADLRFLVGDDTGGTATSDASSAPAWGIALAGAGALVLAAALVLRRARRTG